MTQKTKSQIGKASRNKGKRFERQCRKVMYYISGWQFWKRTQRGDTQFWGDLVPCNEYGQETDGLGYYVECRTRGTLTKGQIAKWVDEVQTKAGEAMAERWVLLCKQDRGPVLAICSVDQLASATYKARIF